MREFDLLDMLCAQRGWPDRVSLPPGDDMGAVRWSVPGDVLCAVDQIVDGVHFQLELTPPDRIAHKALGRNLSDVAAMAALPVAALASITMPRSMDESLARSLLLALQAAGDGAGCPFIGGDLTFWDHPLVMAITVLAESAGVEPVLRTGAREGDLICVTGELGGSLASDQGPPHHLNFTPRIALARSLASNPRTRPHCMIDLSDGLAGDLRHLCRAGEVGAEIWVDRLPIRPAARRAAARQHLPDWMLALGDGEDYELCFTIDRQRADRWLPESIDGVPITRVGTITPADADGEEVRSRIRLRMPDGRLEPVEGMGWEHES